MNEDVPTRSRAWIAGVGLMLALTTVLPAAHAAKMARQGGPCVKTGSGGVIVGECNYGGATVNTVLQGTHPLSSSSSSFGEVDATAVGEDVRVTWTFDEAETDANVTAFDVRRGLDPHLVPATMEQVATVGPDAGTYLDEAGTASGDAWYVVTARLADGSTEESKAFRVSGVRT